MAQFFDTHERLQSYRASSRMDSDRDDSENLEAIVSVMVTDGSLQEVEFNKESGSGEKMHVREVNKRRSFGTGDHRFEKQKFSKNPVLTDKNFERQSCMLV